MGVYRFKDRNCVFSTEAAVNEFLNEPSKYLQGVIDVCRAKPHLIRLFRVEEQFKNLNLKLNFGNYTFLYVESGTLLSNKLMVDKELQTPTHFVEKNLDPNYCWNEWELRRKVNKEVKFRQFKWQIFENDRLRLSRLF